MWIKLGNEYVNLDQVIRVRFNKGFKNGQEEWSAELEGFIRGEVQIFLRYRGNDAQLLYAIFNKQAAQPGNLQAPIVTTVASPETGNNTVHDIKIP